MGVHDKSNTYRINSVVGVLQSVYDRSARTAIADEAAVCGLRSESWLLSGKGGHIFTNIRKTKTGGQNASTRIHQA